MGHDVLVCSECGNLRSECSDPERDWHPRQGVCYATATVKWGWRRLEEKHKDEAYTPEALHSLDGVLVGASEFPPEGDDPFA